MTDRLYFTDSYLKSFEGAVLRAEDSGKRLYFDRTALYPTSGGQPNDLGFCNDIPVTDVIDENGNIAHILAEPLAAGTGSVHCEIDWHRRYDHMQQHTGQHLLSAVLEDLFGFATLSFRLSAETSSIDISSTGLTDKQLIETQERIASICAEARPIFISFESAEEASDLRKASERTGMLRIISIDGTDKSACGGTHVRSTSEISPLLLRRQERVRGNIRLEFVCGLRALKLADAEFRLLQMLARDAGVPAGKLAPTFAALVERAKTSDKERTSLAMELARRDAQALYEATASTSGGIRFAVHEAPIDDIARAFAQAFAQQGHAAVAVISRQPYALLVASSPDSGLNVGELLKNALQKHGGRGGGSLSIAQGSIPDEGALHAVLVELGFPGRS